MTTDDRSPHAEQDLPYEWTTVKHNDEVLITYQSPEQLPETYRVSKKTTNPRVLATADACLFDGSVVQPIYDPDIQQVKFLHDWAGQLGRTPIDEQLDSPTFVLEPLDTDLGDALIQI